MTSIDNNEIFEQYYQTEYDFNTASLTLNEIAEIKRLAREKRVDYASAPMGIGIFDLIQKHYFQHHNLPVFHSNFSLFRCKIITIYARCFKIRTLLGYYLIDTDIRIFLQL